jgi:hypothetical protein
MIKYLHESFCRDAHITIPTFDFSFKINIPTPNKARIILERDKTGKIVSSETPETYPL